MKNHLFLMLSFLIILSSCGEESLSDQIQNQWIGVESTSTSCSNTADNSTVYYGDDGCLMNTFGSLCEYLTFDFLEGGIIEITNRIVLGGDDFLNETFQGTYSVNDNNETVEICFSNQCVSYSVLIESNSLTLSGDDPISGCFETTKFEK